jgi:hypothetical protein
MKIKAEDVSVHIMHTGSGFGQRTTGIRLEHRPTGITAECEEHHSQHANKDAAWKLLQIKMEKVKEPKKLLVREEVVEELARAMMHAGRVKGVELADVAKWPGYTWFAQVAAAVLDQYVVWKPRPLQVGDTCRIVSGFSTGARGMIQFVEPGGHIWLQREYASSPTRHLPEELELLHTSPNQSTQNEQTT